MKRTFIKKGFLACIITLLAAASSFAQTISNTSVTPAAVCAGGDLSVVFTSTGSFGTGNIFTVELSKADGAFPGTVLPTTGSASPLIVKIPASTDAGAIYKLRVISSAPAVTGTESATITIKALPPAPYSGVYSPTICIGDTPSPLKVSSIPGSTVRWYALDGTELPGAPSPSTSVPRAASNPYVFYTQTVGGCESARGTIGIDVLEVAKAPTVIPPANVCQNSAVTSDILRNAISVNPAGATFSWYDVQSGQSSSTAPIPSTLNAGSQTYEVSVDYARMCESPKATITLNVVPAPLAPGVSNKSYTVGQTGVPALSATGTGSLIWFTQESGGVGVSTAPTPSTSVEGITSYWVTQTVDACESARARIDVVVSAIQCTPSPAPTIVQPAAICQNNTLINTTTILSQSITSTGTNYKWYSSANATAFTTTIPSTSVLTPGSFDYYVTQTNSGQCESPKSKVTIIVTPAPSPPGVVNRNYTVGQTNIPALTATGTGTFFWFMQEVSGNSLPAAPVPSTATEGTTSYWVTQTINNCESPRAKLDVIVSTPVCTPPPAPIVVSSQINYTVGQTADRLTATGTALKWYNSADVLLPAAPTPTTTAVGTQTFKVSQTVGGCESAKAVITVTITACVPPAAPTTTATLSYTVGAVAPALTATGTALKWYNSADVLLPAAPTPTTTAVGTQTYKVTQTIGGCESAKAIITVTISACPLSAAPTVTSPLSYCASTTSAAALVATGTAIKWYSSTNVLLTAPPVPAVNVSTTTATTYYVTQTESGKCESAKKEVIVTVYKTPAPAVSADVKEYCLNETAVALTATGTDLKWYSSSTGTASVSPIPVTTAVGTQTFYVSQTLNNCESERARVDVRIKALPAAPTVGALAPVCQDATVASTVLLAAITPQTGLSWYTAATGGNGSAAAPAVVTNTSGIKNYYVAQTVNGCESAVRATLALDVKALPAVPIVTPVAYCKDVAGATALTATGTALKWYTAATGGTALTQTPTPSTTTVGTIPYYVSQTATYTGTTLTCEGPRAKLDVVTNPLPVAPVAFSDALCQEREDKTFTFTATPSAGNSIVWYAAATGTAAGPTTVNLKTPGETTTYAVQKTTATGCESPTRAAFKMRVKPLPAVPGIAASLIEYCQFVGATPLSASPLSGASLNWYGTSATGGNSSPTAPTPSTAEGGTTSYYVAQTLEGCLGDRAKIDVKINTTPKPVTQTYLAYCQGVEAPILDATGTVLKWYRQATDTEFQGYPYTPFTGKVEDYSFWVTQTGSNNCESPKEEIKIHIKALPSATIGGSREVSLGEQATISLTFTGDGPWKYILSSGDTGTATQSPASVNVTPVTTTTYFVTEISNECGKGTPIGSAQITVKVPTIVTGSPSVAETCAGTSFTVPFQRSGDFPAGNTFKVQIAQVNEDAAFYSIPSVPGLNTIVATFPDTTKGGSYFVRVVNSGANPAFTAKGSVNTVGIAALPLPVATITGTQTVLIGSPATLKVEITGKGPWTFTLSDGTRDSVITAATSPYSFLITPRVTSTYTIKTASNACGVGKGAGSARVQVDPILGVEPPVTDWLKVYPTVTSAECTVEITTAVVNKDARIQIIDLKGRPVHEQKISNKTTQLDFTRYPAGLYLIQVQNGNLRSVNRVMKP